MLVLGTVAVYAPVRNYDFVSYDDGDYITKNPYVLGGLTWQDFVWAFTKFHSDNWHPLTWLSHMLDVQCYGLNPGGHHVTNVIIHSLNAVLLFLVFVGVTGAIWRSAFVAAIFAWHPLHVESVAWISERKDVLSGFFWILTMAAYLLHIRQPKLSRYFILVAFCFALGLMSKPMLVTLPFVLLLLDYWPLRRASLMRSDVRKWLSLAVEKIPLFILAIISSVITFLAQREAIITLHRLPFPVRLNNAIISYAAYLSKFVWPVNLAVFYPMQDSIHFWQLTAAVVALLAGTTVAIATAKRHPYLLVGWLWFIGTLVPVIGIVQVGNQAMADRYMYIPLIGLSIATAWGVPNLVRVIIWSEMSRRVALPVISGAVLIASIVTTAKQLAYWQNSLRLFQHTLAVTKDNWFAHGNIAISLGNKGDIAGAITHYRELLRIKPDSVEALNNLAWYLASSNDDRYRNGTEALELAERALQLSPNPDPSTLDTLATALAENHRFAEAIAEAERARDIALYRTDSELADRISERIELYKKGLPYRK
jgi:tetratricopeptide (TPR) repeat protein